MSKMKFGLVAMGLLGAVACGDSGGSNETADASSDTGGGSAGANAPSTNGDSAGTNGDSAGTNGGSAGTNGAGTNGVSAGEDDGGTTGAGGEGACTNDADMAIIDAAGVPKLGCEGGACVGLHLDFIPPKIREAEVRTCVGDDAPTLKRLTPGCQTCFADISICVPSECVMLLGGDSDACSNGAALPETDFKTCDAPAQPKAECNQCQMDNCKAAFVACSGIEN